MFNFNHGGLWRDISNAPNSQARNMMIDFIRRHTGTPPRTGRDSSG